MGLGPSLVRGMYEIGVVRVKMNYTVEYPGGVPRGLEDWLLWKTCTFGIRSTLNTVLNFPLPSSHSKVLVGISLVVQWIRLCNPNAGDLGAIPGQESKILHMASKPERCNY